MNRSLMLGGVLSMLAGLLHLAIIIGGPDWYRFFGAPEEFAQEAAQGLWHPAIVTLGIALLLFAWAAYAFSGAGWLRRLPLLRPALVLITAIYLLRGLVLVPVWVLKPELVNAFAVWSSLICLGYGLAHLAGLSQRWRAL